MTRPVVAAAVCALLLAAGCGGNDDDSDATTTSTSLATTTTTTEAAPRTYTVQSGDTLFDIANRFGSTVAAFVEANGIENPDRLVIGQVLTLPAGASATTVAP